MAGPWEKYSTPEATGPWQRYDAQPQEPTQEPGLESGVTGHLKSLARTVASLPPARVPDWVPLIGGYQPSAASMVHGAYEGAKSGVTLPGDVYSGKVDPLSDEGIKRSMDLATTAVLPAPTRSVSLAKPAASLPVSEVKAVASQGYQAATKEGRSIPFDGTYAPQRITDVIEAQAGPRAARAPLVHEEINTLRRAQDLGDVLDVRQNLKTQLGAGGSERVAAALAMTEVDNIIEKSAPGLMPTLKAADANWGAAARAETVQDLYTQAEKGGTRGRPMGTRLQETFRPFVKNEDAQFGFKPMEKEALGQISQPGVAMGLLRTGAAFDPTTSALGPILAGASAIHSPWALAAMPAGLASRLVYDRAMKNRVNDLAEILLSRAPASMAATGKQRVLSLPEILVNPATGFGNQ